MAMARPHNNSATFTSPVFDQPRAEAAVRELLIAIGEDPDRHGLEDTTRRGWRGRTRRCSPGSTPTPDTVLDTTFDEQHDELVLVKQIPLYSTCEHHLVAFHGVAHVGYIPGVDGRVTGLSKIARLVDLYAKRPQIQERLTRADRRRADEKNWIRVAPSSSSRPNTCACRCVGCASPAPSPRRRQCAGSSRSMRHRGSEALDLILRR